MRAIMNNGKQSESTDILSSLHSLQKSNRIMKERMARPYDRYNDSLPPPINLDLEPIIALKRARGDRNAIVGNRGSHRTSNLMSPNVSAKKATLADEQIKPVLGKFSEINLKLGEDKNQTDEYPDKSD